MLVLIMLALSITAYVINEIFKIAVKLQFKETQTDTDVGLKFTFLFRKDALDLELFIDSNELSEKTNLSQGQQLNKSTIPYNKMNDVGFLTNIVMTGCEPIFQAITDGTQNGVREETGKNVTINSNTIRNEFREEIRNFLINQKVVLDLLVYYTNIFSMIIIGIFVYFICVSLYLLLSPKLFLITLLFGIISFILTIVFSTLVFYVPTALKKLNSNIIFETKTTIILFLTNTYLLSLLFIVHYFTKKNKNKNKNKKGKKSKKN